MLRSFKIILTFSIIIFVLFGVFFLSNYEKEQIGLGYKYINNYCVDITLINQNGASVAGLGRYNSVVEINGREYWIGCDYRESDNSVQEDFTNERIIISHYVNENTNGYRSTGTPIVAYASGTYYNAVTKMLYIREIKFDLSIDTFSQIIVNNVDMFGINSKRWEDVDGVLDFAEFIYDFIRDIFVLIIDIFNDMGEFLG